MAISKKQSNSKRQEILAGANLSTATLSLSGDQEIVQLGMVASRITVQATGSLNATVTYSVNGTDYFTGATLSSTAPATYNTHNVTMVKVVWTSGSGRVAIAAS